MTDPDDTDDRKEPRHAKEEYDRHEDDLEGIDPEEVVTDAMEFFTAGDDEPEEPMQSPSSP